MKTKVWIVIWGLKDGGAEVLARDYARLANKDAFETTIITMYPFEDTANFQRAKEAGLRIISIFMRRNAVTRAARALLGKWYVPSRLKRLLKKERPDTIHFNSQMALYFEPIQKELSKVRLLYTCHNEVSKYFSEKEEKTVRQLIQNPGLRLVALHEDMKKELDQTFGKEDTVVIRNGVDLSNIRNLHIDKKEKLQSIGIEKDAYIVGHVGRFSEQKNHGFLLEIFREIAQKKADAHLLLIGSGELQEEMQQKIREMDLEDRVTILSHRTDVPELLRAMDVLVFPSFYEGLSVVLVEAQASGLKCVVSDSINTANYLTQKTIPVSLSEAPEKWADIVLDDTVTHTPLGNIEDYDMNREIRRLERLYQGQLDV